MKMQLVMNRIGIVDALRDNAIALCPIRQIGKTAILLNRISVMHFGRAIVVVPTNMQRVELTQMWIEGHMRTYQPRLNTEDPPQLSKLDIVTNAKDLERLMYGRPSFDLAVGVKDGRLPIYFDEYMNLEEGERFRFYRLEKELESMLYFAGGTGTLR